jgi:hypothetical protein
VTENELDDIQNALVHAADRTRQFALKNQKSFTPLEFARRAHIANKLNDAAELIGEIRAKLREGEEL